MTGSRCSALPRGRRDQTINYDGHGLTFLAAALFVATSFLKICFVDAILASTFVLAALLAALFLAGAASCGTLRTRRYAEKTAL
jgi:hypothetical protein